MDGRIAQQIVDKNGHTKTVWLSNKNEPVLSSVRNRIPTIVPASHQANDISSNDIENWAKRNALPLAEDEEFIDLVNATIVKSGDYSDSGFQKAYNTVFQSNFGGYTVESLRDALSVSTPLQTEKPEVVLSSDKRVQNGDILDIVQHDGVNYHRTTKDVYPTDVYSMRFQFSRKLTEEEAKHARDLIAYAWAARIRGENLSDEVQDSPFSIIIDGDSTKSRSDDVGYALDEWEEMVRSFIETGTQQKNESLRIPPLDSNISLEIYYDNVGYSTASGQ